MLLTGNLLQNSLKLFGLIIIFVLIIVSCYYVTRFVGTKSMGTIRESNIKVIDVYRVNQNQCLMIVGVGKKYFLLSSGKDSVTMLSELSEEDITILSSGTNKTVSFHEVFASFAKKKDDNNKEE